MKHKPQSLELNFTCFGLKNTKFGLNEWLKVKDMC